MVKSIVIATEGKGFSALGNRARSISERYGLTAGKFDRALQLFATLLKDYDCGASFPITASALARYGSIIKKYESQNIEFAMHGLFHVDYSQLSLSEQDDHLERARQIFRQKNVQLVGFRCPYLRWNNDTLIAISNSDLSYDSSQALSWDVIDGHLTEDYHRVLGFYRARSAEDYPALPKVMGGVIQIPYCVPDDEALIERLKLKNIQAMADIWLAILEQTYHLGELFTLGLHPERIGLLHQPLAMVLAQARSLTPEVWIARLDEVTHWWRARCQATLEVEVEEDGLFHVTVQGPPGTAVLARNVDIKGAIEPGQNGLVRVLATDFRFQANRRPFIGLSPDADPALTNFLKQQGYWVETGPEDQGYSIYLRQPRFAPEDERPLLRQLVESEAPLVRLARWPNGAQSALCVTGDIDALTLWDYGLRVLGR